MDAYGLAIKGDVTIPDDNTYTVGGASNRMVNIYSVLFTGVATSSQWGDLAEKYSCEDNLPIGTVISVSTNSNYDVCKCDIDCDIGYVGIVSEKPGFLMNSNIEDGLVTGLIGKVPVKIKGKIKKRDFIVPTLDGYARAGKVGEEAFKMGISLETSEEEIKLVLCIIK